MQATSVTHELPGIERHSHARAVLAGALAPGGAPSHAYLLHGPAGAGKRVLARALAAELLAVAGAPDAQTARDTRERALRGVHPDLTWVSPSGAAEMLVGDIDEPVVAAAARTPFEAGRRVFVIDGADTLGEQAANRLLKTLEEPPAYVHLLLIADRREEVLQTVASRCVHVRFDALPAREIARMLLQDGVCAEEREAAACAGLALGDATRARELAGERGREQRAAAETYVRSALAGDTTSARCWSALLAAADAAAAAAGADAQAGLAERLELAPARERRRLERESQEAGRRVQRRARAGAIDDGLRLGELWLRDLLCVGEGAQDLVYAADRIDRLNEDARRVFGSRVSPGAGATGRGVRRGIELVRDTRARLRLNVAEELALEALAYRLARALAPL